MEPVYARNAQYYLLRMQQANACWPGVVNGHAASSKYRRDKKGNNCGFSLLFWLPFVSMTVAAAAVLILLVLHRPVCCSVSSEVLNSTETARALYHRWQELMSENANVSKEEYNWTTNELRNCLRSIEWDLEDLEETVDIL